MGLCHILPSLSDDSITLLFGHYLFSGLISRIFFSLWYFILACTHRLHPLDRQFWYHKISARQFEVHQTKPGFPMKIPCLRRFVKLSRFLSVKHGLISQIFFRIILAIKYTPKMILFVWEPVFSQPCIQGRGSKLWHEHEFSKEKSALLFLNHCPNFRIHWKIVVIWCCFRPEEKRGPLVTSI